MVGDDLDFVAVESDVFTDGSFAFTASGLVKIGFMGADAVDDSGVSASLRRERFCCIRDLKDDSMGAMMVVDRTEVQ